MQYTGNSFAQIFIKQEVTLLTHLYIFDIINICCVARPELVEENFGEVMSQDLVRFYGNQYKHEI